MNDDLTDEQRARALELYNTWADSHGYDAPRAESMTTKTGRSWLAVEAHVLASHTRPDAESDPRVQAWLTIAKHPFFADCYSVDDTLLNAVLAKLDAAHAHTCEPVWRPVSFAEIQAGWMIRSRDYNGREANWGVTHHKDEDGDWFTEAGVLLTCDRARGPARGCLPARGCRAHPARGCLAPVHRGCGRREGGGRR